MFFNKEESCGMFTEEDFYDVLDELLIEKYVKYVRENILSTKYGLLLRDIPMSAKNRENLFDTLQMEYRVLTNEDFCPMFVLID